MDDTVQYIDPKMRKPTNCIKCLAKDERKEKLKDKAVPCFVQEVFGVNTPAVYQKRKWEAKQMVFISSKEEQKGILKLSWMEVIRKGRTKVLAEKDLFGDSKSKPAGASSKPTEEASIDPFLESILIS